MCDRLKEQRDRAESEHQEECDLYMKRNHDLKAEVDRLHLDVTDRQVSQYRQVDRLHPDVTYQQVKGRSNSNSRTWLYVFHSTVGCLGKYKFSSYVLCEQTRRFYQVSFTRCYII